MEGGVEEQQQQQQPAMSALDSASQPTTVPSTPSSSGGGNSTDPAAGATANQLDGPSVTLLKRASSLGGGGAGGAAGSRRARSGDDSATSTASRGQHVHAHSSSISAAIPLHLLPGRSESAPPRHRATSPAPVTVEAQHSDTTDADDDSTQDASSSSVAGEQRQSLSSSTDDDSAGRTHPEDEAETPQIDRLLLDGLKVAKDRILLLRSDMELEAFVADVSRTRLRIAPPSFPPALNSYQRLLIHRLADLWNVTRELESAASSALMQSQNTVQPGSGAAASTQAKIAEPQRSNHGGSTGSTISGTIVLVKTPKTRVPPFRIATLIPPTSSETSSSGSSVPSLATKLTDLKVTPAASVSETLLKAQPASAPPNGASSHSTAASSTSLEPKGGLLSPTTPTSSSTPVSPSPIRIMSRANASNQPGSLSSSKSNSPVPRSGSSVSGSNNAGLTYEEREAAYQEARMRIFNSNQGGSSSKSASGPASSSGASSSSKHGANASGHRSASRKSSSGLSLDEPVMRMGGSLTQNQPSNGSQNDGMSGMSHPQQYHTQGQPPLYAAAAPSSHLPPHFQTQQHAMNAPPIQIVMANSATPGMPYGDPNMQNQAPYNHPAVPEYHLGNLGQPMQFSPYPAPLSRPASSQSCSSRSSISTAASISSVRTASTSSVAYSLNNTRQAAGPAGLEPRPLRQTSNGSKHYGQHVQLGRQRPALSVAAMSSNQSSAPPSRHSHSSSSTSTSTSASNSISISAGVSVSGGSTSGSVNGSHIPTLDSGTESNPPSGKGKGREVIVTPLPGPHPSLPKKPVWGKSESSIQSISDTPSLASTSSAPASPVLSSASNVQSPSPSTDAVSTPASSVLENGTATQDLQDDKSSVAGGSQTARTSKEASASTSASDVKTPSLAPKIVEYPPLRYDPNKGWTSLSTGAPVEANKPASAFVPGPKSPGPHKTHSTPKHTASTPSTQTHGAQQRSMHQSQHHHPQQQPQQNHHHHHPHQQQSQQAFVQHQQVQQQMAPGMQSPQQYYQPQPLLQQQQQQQQEQQYYQVPIQMVSSPPLQAQTLQGHQMLYSQGGQAQVQQAGGPQMQQAYFYPQQQQQPGQYISESGMQQQQQMQPQGQKTGAFVSQPQYQYALVPVAQGSPVATMQAGYVQAQYPTQQGQHFVPSQQQPQPGFQSSYVQQQQQQQSFPGGLTAADIISQGEMLYSYDIPRPTPRTGATLFDPNASGRR